MNRPLGLSIAADPYSLGDANQLGITGKRLTPYLLSRLAEVTGGASIRANRALAKHNARVGAELALAYDKRPVLEAHAPPAKALFHRLRH